MQTRCRSACNAATMPDSEESAGAGREEESEKDIDGQDSTNSLVSVSSMQVSCAETIFSTVHLVGRRERKNLSPCLPACLSAFRTSDS
eukprot:330536-Hanusia_phi.AAC.1